MRGPLELPAPEGKADLTSGPIFLVGNATVIVRYAGFTILTDPNFLHAGDHVHLGYGVTSRRRTDPAIELDELPPDLDFVLLSHFHGDHLDRVVQARLDRSLPIVTTPHAARKLAEKEFRETYPRILGSNSASARTTSTPRSRRRRPGTARRSSRRRCRR